MLKHYSLRHQHGFIVLFLAPLCLWGKQNSPPNRLVR